MKALLHHIQSSSKSTGATAIQKVTDCINSLKMSLKHIDGSTDPIVLMVQNRIIPWCTETCELLEDQVLNPINSAMQSCQEICDQIVKEISTTKLPKDIRDNTDMINKLKSDIEMTSMSDYQAIGALTKRLKKLAEDTTDLHDQLRGIIL